MLITAAILIILSVQLVSPTRRWRLRRTRRAGAAAATATATGPEWAEAAEAVPTQPAQAVADAGPTATDVPFDGRDPSPTTSPPGDPH
jgi:hypothetical protein